MWSVVVLLLLLLLYLGSVTALVTGPSLTHQLTVDRGVSQDYGKTFTIRKIVSQLRICWQYSKAKECKHARMFKSYNLEVLSFFREINVQTAFHQLMMIYKMLCSSVLCKVCVHWPGQVRPASHHPISATTVPYQ